MANLDCGRPLGAGLVGDSGELTAGGVASGTSRATRDGFGEL